MAAWAGLAGPGGPHRAAADEAGLRALLGGAALPSPPAEEGGYLKQQKAGKQLFCERVIGRGVLF